VNKNNEYHQIFAQRGARYLRALSAYPDARAEEFEAAIASARPLAGQRIIDVPAGGGMLQRFLPSDCAVVRLECAPGFSQGPNLRSHARANASSWPVTGGWADRVISVAGVHHLLDKRGFFQEAWRCLVPGGVLLLAEVAEGSAVADFLDGFVDAHNPEGHHGYYLNQLTVEQLQQTGFVVDSINDCSYQWRFADAEALVAFCSDQFGLQSLPTTKFVEELSGYLSLRMGRSSQVNLPWMLRHIRAIKPVV